MEQTETGYNWPRTIQFILIFLLTIYILYTFAGEAATFWVLSILLTGMVFNNYTAIINVTKGMTRNG